MNVHNSVRLPRTQGMRVIAAVALGVTATSLAARPVPGRAEPTPEVRFEVAVAPLLERHCVRCHGGEAPKAHFRVTSGALILQGGESGPAVVPGRPDESPLVQLIESGEMPPEKDKRLSRAETDLIRRWVAAGARLPGVAEKSEGWTQHEILPILMLRCAACHGRQRREGNLDIRSVKSLLTGGKSGPAMTLGNPDASLLIQKITTGEMPPKKQLAAVSVKPVEPSELAKLREWIAAGARQVADEPDVPNGKPDPLVSDEDRQFWSFQRLRPVAIPPGATPRAGNPIDLFVLDRLRKAGLDLSPPADRLTLLRRAYVDLLGLPPDADLAREFADNPDPQAYERLVDRLLASPRYGERWAQYWLDLAGYSDSEGVQDSDLVRPHAYRYRDYVVRALNADKPYDRFLLEQLAGDELADYESSPITPELYDNLVATGFLRMSPDGTFAGITGFVPERLDVIDDQLRIVGSAILGLTIGCARCHSHKFDPFPQRDYYRLAAVFKGALDEHAWLKPTRQAGEPGTQDRYLPYVLPDERDAWQAHEASLNDKLVPLKKQLAEMSNDAEAKKKLEGEIKALEAQRRPQPLIRALWDRGEPSPTYVLRRGNYLTPGKLVGPAVPSVLSDGRTPLMAAPPWPGSKKTGLRLALARWLTTADHPLTARVLVNRVWKHHFGEGLVRTIDNFGRTGDPPSHPELLDWLAIRFTQDGWSLKSLHRLILTSATYQQASLVSDEHLQRDPEQRLLAHFAPRRLDGEALYDHLWALAGRLTHRPYGAPDPVTARPDGLVVPAVGPGAARRAIFLLQRRSQPLTLLADFDRPAMSPNCVARTDSTVAPQALHLLNSALVHELAESFAQRIVAEVGDDPPRQLDEIHWRALGRPPTDERRRLGRESLNALRAAWRTTSTSSASPAPANEREAGMRALTNYCHAVINSAEFLFVD